MRSLLLVFFANSVWESVYKLGGPGLILIGIVDNSLFPLPGSMDVFVILLSAHRHSSWPYYGLMATAGAVLGGYISYRLAEKGGEETLERKIGKRRAEKVYKYFEKRGFATVAIAAILPPPFPTVPVLMAAGVLHYRTKNFLLALSTGRGVRFLALAYVGHVYGKAIIGALQPYYKPVLYSLIALAAAGVTLWLVYIKWYRPRTQRAERARGEKVEDWPVPGRHNGSKSK